MHCSSRRFMSFSSPSRTLWKVTWTNLTNASQPHKINILVILISILYCMKVTSENLTNASQLHMKLIYWSFLIHLFFIYNHLVFFAALFWLVEAHSYLSLLKDCKLHHPSRKNIFFWEFFFKVASNVFSILQGKGT